MNPISLRPRHLAGRKAGVSTEHFTQNSRIERSKNLVIGGAMEKPLSRFSVPNSHSHRSFGCGSNLKTSFLSLLPFPFSKKRVHICRGANKCTMLGKILDGAEEGGRQRRRSEMREGRRPTWRRVGGKSCFHVSPVEHTSGSPLNLM